MNMRSPFQVNALDTAAVVTRSSAETEGAYAEVVAVLPRCTEETTLHRHPLQTIQMEAIDGKLGIMLPDRRLIIKPGQSFEIPRNMEHAVYNADEKAITFKSTLKPALHTEWLAKELRAATHRKGSKWMSAIEQSYILNQIRKEYRRTGLPAALHSLLALVGKVLGIGKRISPLY